MENQYWKQGEQSGAGVVIQVRYDNGANLGSNSEDREKKTQLSIFKI